jgi:hypothetical protein
METENSLYVRFLNMFIANALQVSPFSKRQREDKNGFAMAVVENLETRLTLSGISRSVDITETTQKTSLVPLHC